MKLLRLLMFSAILALPLRAEEARSGSALQDITRDAQERLKQWDAEDAKEQQLESKYWWLGFFELALSLTLGRVAFPFHGATFTENGGLAVHRQRQAPPKPAPSAPDPSLKKDL